MSIERSRATTVSGAFDLLGRRAPARSTISRTDIGTEVSRRISSTTASVLMTVVPPSRKDVCVWSVETGDRKSTRLNSSHLVISYAVFCLKKKKKIRIHDVLACSTLSTVGQ